MPVVVHCGYCGKEFVIPKKNFRQSKSGKNFCTKTCYHLSRRERVALNCAVCGKEFSVRKSHLRKGAKFCSSKCSKRGQKPWREKHWLNKTCALCGKHFVRPAGNTQKFCSRKCMGLYLGQTRRRAAHPNWKGGQGIMDYGPDWLRIAARVRARDNHTCQACGLIRKGSVSKKVAGLPVHHIKSLRSFNGDYIAANQYENLITLCETCHKSVELGKLAVQPRLF